MEVFFLPMELDPIGHIKKQNEYVLNLFVKFDFVFINNWNQEMVPIFLRCSYMQFNEEENNLNIEFKQNVFCCVISIDISNLFRKHKFWWFAKLIISINHIRRSWNNFFPVCSEDDIFYSIPFGGLKQVTLSQQLLFVINLVRFLYFNPNTLARFGIFPPKSVYFTLHDAVKDVKM